MASQIPVVSPDTPIVPTVDAPQAPVTPKIEEAVKEKTKSNTPVFPEGVNEPVIMVRDLHITNTSNSNNQSTTNVTPLTNGPMGNFPEEFFKQNNNTINGEDVGQWAFKAALYREAIKKLRDGKLDNIANQAIINHEKIANAIDDWVTEQFYAKLTINTAQFPNIYHEAIMAFWYWQAVDKLRNGEFHVLNYKEAADAIERWVKQQALRKLGILQGV